MSLGTLRKNVFDKSQFSGTPSGGQVGQVAEAISQDQKDLWNLSEKYVQVFQKYMFIYWPASSAIEMYEVNNTLKLISPTALEVR